MERGVGTRTAAYPGRALGRPEIVATATTAIAVAAAMRYPDWFKTQVVQAVTLHGLSYLRASHLYDVADETIRKWVNGAADAPAGLGRLEALEHRVGRIEHYLALAEEIWHQGREGSRRHHPAGRANGHNESQAVRKVNGHGAAHAVLPSLDNGRANGS
jgi:transposase-like protein